MWLQQAGGTMLNADNTATAFNSEAGMTVLDFWDQLMNQAKRLSTKDLSMDLMHLQLVKLR